MGILELAFWNGHFGVGSLELAVQSWQFRVGILEWAFWNGHFGMGSLSWHFGMGILEWAV